MSTVLPLRKSFSLSLVFHVVLFAALLISFVLSPPMQPPTALNLQQSNKIVQAVSVNQAQVEQEMANLKKQQSQAQAAEQARLAALKKQASLAAQAKAQQEKALAQLKAQQVAVVKQQQAQLAALQQQQQAAQKQLKTAQDDAQKVKQQAALQQKKVEQQKQLQQAAEQSLQQQLNQTATQLDKAKQQQINSQLAKYTELIRQAIGQQWIIPPNTNPALYCILEIKLASGGVVSNVSIKQSSGDDILDRSAITAVYKASPLPVPTDPNLFKLMQDINLKVQPNNAV